MKNNILPTGKIDVQILSEMLKQFSRTDKRVLLGPCIGEDTAIIDMGDKALVVTTDPITFATDEIGYYSVIVNANDIATTGAEPRWYTVSILLPEKPGNERQAINIFEQINLACEKLNISLIGGHTEITYGLDRPLIVGQMMGEVKKGSFITTAGARPGDIVLLSKGITIEGTSIIAREKEDYLLSHNISEKFIKRAKDFLFDPGISIVKEARLASQSANIHAMHDVTEGGLANGLHELAMAAGVKIVIDENQIPIYSESRILCETFALDPMGVIASGSLLITASPDQTGKIFKAASKEGIILNNIGRIDSTGTPSVVKITPKGEKLVPYFERDEITKIF